MTTDEMLDNCLKMGPKPPDYEPGAVLIPGTLTPGILVQFSNYVPVYRDQEEVWATWFRLPYSVGCQHLPYSVGCQWVLLLNSYWKKFFPKLEGAMR